MATTLSLVLMYVFSAAFIVAGLYVTYALDLNIIGVALFLIGGWLFIMPMMRKRYL
jgi:hypothetical protein